MQVWIEEDLESMSKRAATFIAKQIQAHSQFVLGLATGSTPLELYRIWVEMVAAGELLFSKVTTFNLDEYIGLAPDHPQSYRFFMQSHFFSHIDIPPQQTHIPNGKSSDLKQECQNYERLICEAGGIDLQILGIGENGHIGFNEPGEPFGYGTHVVTLAESTRHANARFFSSVECVPTSAITMGLRSIMNARQVVLLASGAHKSEAVVRALQGEITEDCPASVLQLHPNCIFVLDRTAASKLELDAPIAR